MGLKTTGTRSVLSSLPLAPGCPGLTLSTGPEVTVCTTPRVPDPTERVEAGDGTTGESNAELREGTGSWGRGLLTPGRTALQWRAAGHCVLQGPVRDRGRSLQPPCPDSRKARAERLRREPASRAHTSPVWAGRDLPPACSQLTVPAPWGLLPIYSFTPQTQTVICSFSQPGPRLAQAGSHMCRH